VYVGTYAGLMWMASLLYRTVQVVPGRILPARGVTAQAEACAVQVE
jgi:hypothetical protein